MAARAAIGALDRPAGCASADAVVRGLVRSGPGALRSGCRLAIALYLRTDWFVWFGIPTPDRSLIPEIASLVGFGTAFTFGWLRASAGRSAPRVAAAVAAAPRGGGRRDASCLWIAGMTPPLAPAPGLKTFGYALAYALAIWCWVFAMTGLAVRFLSQESRHSAVCRRLVRTGSISRTLPIVAAFQVLVGHLPWHWSIKFPLILAAASRCCLRPITCSCASRSSGRS